jgi:hypothetical protein
MVGWGDGKTCREGSRGAVVALWEAVHRADNHRWCESIRRRISSQDEVVSRSCKI